LKSRLDRAMATTRRKVSITATASTLPANGRVPTVRRPTVRRVKRPSGKRRSGLHVAQSRGPEHLAWYAGITVMALFEVIEWPVALVIAVGHEIAHRSRSKALRELAEGIEAGG
jgi:hypothetical protein